MFIEHTKLAIEIPGLKAVINTKRAVKRIQLVIIIRTELVIIGLQFKLVLEHIELILEPIERIGLVAECIGLVVKRTELVVRRIELVIGLPLTRIILLIKRIRLEATRHIILTIMAKHIVLAIIRIGLIVVGEHIVLIGLVIQHTIPIVPPTMVNELSIFRQLGTQLVPKLSPKECTRYIDLGKLKERTQFDIQLHSSL